MDAIWNGVCLRCVSTLPFHSPLILLLHVLGLILWFLCLSLNTCAKSGNHCALLGRWFVLTCWSHPASMLYSANYVDPTGALSSDKRSFYSYHQSWSIMLPWPYFSLSFSTFFSRLSAMEVSMSLPLQAASPGPSNTHTPVQIWKGGWWDVSSHLQYPSHVLFKNNTSFQINMSALILSLVITLRTKSSVGHVSTWKVKKRSVIFCKTSKYMTFHKCCISVL